MLSIFPAAAIILATLAQLRTQDVRAVDTYITDNRPAAGLGIGEELPNERAPPELAPRIAIQPVSGDTEENISYVEDLLAGRVNSSRDLPKSILASDYEVSQSEELATKTEKLEVGIEPYEDNYNSDNSAEKTQTARQAAAPSVNRAHPESPCPSVFSYDGNKAGKERWYGVVLVNTDVTLTGLRFEIQLDKASHLLGTWLGEVSSTDNIRYTIWNGKRKIVPGPPLSVKFFVKYSEQEVPPRLRTIRLNGRQICPAEGSNQYTLQPPPASPISRPKPVTVRPTVARPVTTARPVTAARPVTTARPVKPVTSRPTARPPITNLNGEWTEIVDGVQCGRVEVQPSPFITHGQRTAKGQWPWHAALYQSKGTDLSYICGGSLIGQKTILTAAHCVSRSYNDRAVDPETVVVYVGKYNLKLWSEGGVQLKEVREIYIHPEYNSTDFRADIAILVFSTPVQFTSFVKPVCLWDTSRVGLNNVEGIEGVVVGWGYDERGRLTDELMMAKMPVVSQQTCIWSYPQFFARFTSERTYCAGFRNGTSVCNGDSGGGMIFPKKGQSGPETWLLRGLVSLGTSQEDKRVCNTKHYVVFTDVAKYLDWIQKYR